jgi:pilus assembly protein CpaE
MNMVRAIEADRPDPETGFTPVADDSASRADRAGGTPSEGQPGRAAAIAFITDDTTEAALRGGLVESMGSVQVRRGGVRAACRALESGASPRVLVVDVTGVEDPVKELDKLALVCEPDTKVLVIGERTDIAFYRDVTRHLGIDEYLSKPLTRDKVSTLIGPYIAGAEPRRAQTRGGRVVAVCGARGGVGATTVAVNLGLQIAEQTHGHVALLDLHLRGGHAAMMLGMRPSAGLRLALEDPDRVDGLFLERVAIAAGDRLRVIAAEEPFDSEPVPTPAGVRQVMDLLRQRFNIIVVDMPMPPSPAEQEALLLARQVLIVLGPDVGSLRDAQQVRRLVTARAGAGRTMMVLNRAGAPGTLKTRLVEEGLGTKPDSIIPDLPRQLPHAANLGRSALSESSVLRRALAPLTQEISGIELRQTRGGLLGRLRRA